MGFLSTIKENAEKALDTAGKIGKATVKAAHDMVIQPAIDMIKDRIINPRIKRYATITDIYFCDHRFYVKLHLLGLENEPFECSVGHIYINDAVTAFQFGDFQANKEFLKNILDDYCTREFKIPDDPKIKIALSTIKSHL